MISTPNNELVVTKKYDTLEEAQQRAAAEIANTGASSFPVVVFHQGNRINLTGALPMSWVRSRLESRQANKKSPMREIQSAWNRPEDSNHSAAIAKYLTENF